MLGVVEFRYAEDVDRAIRQLDGTDWNGHKVKVTDASGRSGGGRRSPSPRGRSPRRSPSKSPRRSPSKSPRRSPSPGAKGSRSPSPAGGRGRSPSPAKYQS